MKRAALPGLLTVACLLAGCGEDDPAPAGSDLRLADLRIPSCTALVQDTTVTMTVIVVSNGTLPVTADFTTRLSFSSNATFTDPFDWADAAVGSEVDWAETDDLIPGEWREYSVDIAIAAADPTGLVFCKAELLDDTATFPLVDVVPGNNVQFKSCQVVTPPADLPDLTVEVTSPVSSSGASGDYTISVDYTVTNEGAAAAAACGVKVEVLDASTEALIRGYTPAYCRPLGAGATEPFSESLPFPEPAGSFTLRVTVDSTFAVAEEDELNNEAERDFAIIE